MLGHQIAVTGFYTGLPRLVAEAQTRLISITSVFPLDLFPDSIIVDENKISIIRRGLLTEQVHGILVEDVTEVTVNAFWVFATLEITDSTNIRFPWVFQIGPLWQSDALSARRVIEGLIEARRQNVDLSMYDKKELRAALDKLGGAKADE